ncbi:hypothetical protein [Planctobacterium marinum]|uniref:hypothetical protein n=1 Tax=Planctobacterium marinum TaxID=1631968 RepID=UPI001E2A4385|nr:hypothetical protein [Planctobacterium marinum]MCC2604066.1 hypothetical protein [Planctobacterium marinum]
MSIKEVQTSGPTTAAIMSKLGMITVDTRNLPATYIMFEHLFNKGFSKIDFELAFNVLKTLNQLSGVSTEIKRFLLWLSSCSQLDIVAICLTQTHGKGFISILMKTW